MDSLLRRYQDLQSFSKSRHKTGRRPLNQNCEGVSRRDSIALGLGGLIGGGLSGALQATHVAASAYRHA